ncbi:MAG: lysostaphin resistance A-like protein [Halorhabdus sp.]
MTPDRLSCPNRHDDWHLYGGAVVCDQCERVGATAALSSPSTRPAASTASPTSKHAPVSNESDCRRGLPAGDRSHRVSGRRRSLPAGRARGRDGHGRAARRLGGRHRDGLRFGFSGHELGGVVGGVRELAVLVALIFGVNAPVEEALFRNVIQKRLASALESRLALGVAALVFGLIHLPVYLSGGIAGAVIPILVVTVAGAGFGIVYARTQNLVAATLSHAVYNAVQVGLAV